MVNRPPSRERTGNLCRKPRRFCWVFRSEAFAWFSSSALLRFPGARPAHQMPVPSSISTIGGDSSSARPRCQAACSLSLAKGDEFRQRLVCRCRTYACASVNPTVVRKGHHKGGARGLLCAGDRPGHDLDAGHSFPRRHVDRVVCSARETMPGGVSASRASG